MTLATLASLAVMAPVGTPVSDLPFDVDLGLFEDLTEWVLSDPAMEPDFVAELRRAEPVAIDPHAAERRVAGWDRVGGFDVVLGTPERGIVGSYSRRPANDVVIELPSRLHSLEVRVGGDPPVPSDVEVEPALTVEEVEDRALALFGICLPEEAEIDVRGRVPESQFMVPWGGGFVGSEFGGMGVARTKPVLQFLSADLRLKFHGIPVTRDRVGSPRPKGRIEFDYESGQLRSLVLYGISREAFVPPSVPDPVAIEAARSELFRALRERFHPRLDEVLDHGLVWQEAWRGPEVEALRRLRLDMIVETRTLDRSVPLTRRLSVDVDTGSLLGSVESPWDQREPGKPIVQPLDISEVLRRWGEATFVGPSRTVAMRRSFLTEPVPPVDFGLPGVLLFDGKLMSCTYDPSSGHVVIEGVRFERVED